MNTLEIARTKSPQPFSRRFLKELVLLTILIPVVTPMALAQGLKGVSSNDCLRDLSQPPVVLAGKNDKERWSKFVTTQPRLLGMSKKAVIASFGNGTSYRKADELSYRLSERKGGLVDLRIKLTKGTVTEYTVSRVLED